MKYRIYSAFAAFCIAFAGAAESVEVNSFKYAGPYPVASPVIIDSLDVSSKKYDVKSKLSTPLSLEPVKSGRDFTDSLLPRVDVDALHLLSFSLDNSHYATAKIKVDGIKNCQIFVDGNKYSGEELKLTPMTRDVVLKCYTDSASSDTLRVSVETPAARYFMVNPTDGRRYSTRDMFTGRFIGSVEVSPAGRYMYTGYYHINKDGSQGGWDYVLTDISSGKELVRMSRPMSWMPRSELMYYTRERDGKTQLVTVDPATMAEKVIADGLPSRRFKMSPTEDFMVYTHMNDGPKESNDGLYQILTPDDRQSGWRNRGQLMRFDFNTGMSTPLTYGHKSVWMSDISTDGRKLLFQVSEPNLGKRPSSLSSIYLLDFATMRADVICDKEPFLGSAILSPDASAIAVTGSPEAFGGIGLDVPAGVVPSMVDNQMFIINIADGKVMPVTRDFDPSIEDFVWNKSDGYIYFSAEDRDRKSLYRVKPGSGDVEPLHAEESYVKGFNVACNAPILAYYGQGADNALRLYTMNVSKHRSTLRDNLASLRTDGLRLEPTHSWSYRTTRGDTVYGRYNLPPGFDPARKYPVIVYYYGGCSPVGTYLDTTYNPHLFAAHGFISLVINPSGATGFGQEFSSRHVATAGDGVAQDIIDGVKRFAEEFSFVDESKIGCCGASYGGFMTQYLQTVTDIFAAAVSHAGISDHTSYWGGGYWGYSYSEVSMANKYPWVDRELYVAHSPLYNADKITTPLLFLHGDADTNVPFGESVQMFTALKLLGKETALVAVKDQDHHILDFNKREKWLNTMLAWFTKYLQDDPSWWDDMYPQKQL